MSSALSFGGCRLGDWGRSNSEKPTGDNPKEPGFLGLLSSWAAGNCVRRRYHTLGISNSSSHFWQCWAPSVGALGQCLCTARVRRAASPDLAGHSVLRLFPPATPHLDSVLCKYTLRNFSFGWSRSLSLLSEVFPSNFSCNWAFTASIW